MLHKTPQLSREASHQSSRVKNSDNHARNEGSVSQFNRPSFPVCDSIHWTGISRLITSVFWDFW